MLAHMKEPGAVQLLRGLPLLLLVVSTFSSTSTEGAQPSREVQRDLAGITTNNLLHHIQVLSSDEFEGRSPGTRGETLTVDYLIGQFRAMGLRPGNPNGTYVQQ